MAYLFCCSPCRAFFYLPLPTDGYKQQADGNAEPHRYDDQLERQRRHQHLLVLIACCSTCLVPNIRCQEPGKERDAPTPLEQSGESRRKGGAYFMFLPTGSVPLRVLRGSIHQQQGPRHREHRSSSRSRAAKGVPRGSVDLRGAMELDCPIHKLPG